MYIVQQASIKTKAELWGSTGSNSLLGLQTAKYFHKQYTVCSIGKVKFRFYTMYKEIFHFFINEPFFCFKHMLISVWLHKYWNRKTYIICYMFYTSLWECFSLKMLYYVHVCNLKHFLCKFWKVTFLSYSLIKQQQINCLCHLKRWFRTKLTSQAKIGKFSKQIITILFTALVFHYFLLK